MCVSRQAREGPLHQCVDIVEVAEKVRSEVVAEVGFRSNAERLSIGVDDDQMTNAEQAGLAISLAEIHVSRHCMNGGGHDLGYRLVKCPVQAHGLHHVAFGDDAVYPAGINHDHGGNP